jgi:hypothetical protein
MESGQNGTDWREKVSVSCEKMVARDGIESLTPAFSGLLIGEDKSHEIIASDSIARTCRLLSFRAV